MGQKGMEIAGARVLITGASKGIGASMAESFADAGARVALAARSEDAITELAARLGGDAYPLDVADSDQLDGFIAMVESDGGPIDILVPNATPDQPLRTIEDYEWAFYQSMIDFFIKSPYLLCRACLPHMKQQRWGRIINIISEVYSLGVAPFTAYSAAKGGQVGFSRSLASELAPFGITVNMISPGWILVERHEKDPQVMKDAYFETIPAGRWGVPDDVAGAVVYYASDEASFVTGQFLTINGGRSFGI